jgi:hypothetical protein
VRARRGRQRTAEKINPVVVDAKREIGVELGRELAVVTIGCGEACPVYPGKRYEDWELDDPAGPDLDTVRPIRDEIDARVHRLVDELLPE